MSWEARTKSIWWRALAMAVLVLLLLWPLGQVRTLVDERASLREQAREGIAAIHGGPQVIGGPLIKVPTEVLIDEWNADLKQNVSRWVVGEPRWLLPASLRIDTAHQTRTQVRGIYSLAVYTLPDLSLRGEFPDGALARLIPDPRRERALWARASVFVPVRSLASLESIQQSDFAGRVLTFGSSSYFGKSGLAAPLDLAALVDGGKLPFDIQLRVRGSSALHFLPMAGATEVRVRSAWPHPSFDGPFAAEHSTPSARGFDSAWRVLEINRDLPRSWSGSAVDGERLYAHRFGFTMLTPVDVYSMTWRALRYGVLFIAVTFLVFFAWEQLNQSVRLHGMNYLLVGLALSVFFLLLLALGEHLSFGLSYAIAAGALVLLLSVYMAGVIGQRLPGVSIGLGLGLCYGCLYVILQSEDNALLLGALLVFGLLAALMLATRRLDWGRVRS